MGLFIPESQFDKVEDLMFEVNNRKEQSNILMIESLNRAGYEIDYEHIKNATPNGKFNRAHVAAELTQKGYTASNKEAFATLLSPEAGHYKEPERLLFFDMLEFLKSIGAVPVLAHPFLELSKDELIWQFFIKCFHFLNELASSISPIRVLFYLTEMI